VGSHQALLDRLRPPTTGPGASLRVAGDSGVAGEAVVEADGAEG
jgi:hypothetical protein